MVVGVLILAMRWHAEWMPTSHHSSHLEPHVQPKCHINLGTVSHSCCPVATSIAKLLWHSWDLELLPCIHHTT